MSAPVYLLHLFLLPRLQCHCCSPRVLLHRSGRIQAEGCVEREVAALQKTENFLLSWLQGGFPLFFFFLAQVFVQAESCVEGEVAALQKTEHFLLAPFQSLAGQPLCVLHG